MPFPWPKQMDVAATKKNEAARERERCAKIAERIADETPDGKGEIYIARKIADAIRKQR